MEEMRSIPRVLVLGRRDYIVEALMKVVKSEGFEVKGCMEDQEVMRMVSKGKVDLLLISGGVEPNSRIMLKTFLGKTYPDIKVLEHFGGPATLPADLRQTLYLSE